MSTIMLEHLKVQLALHKLRPGEGRPLLLLHGLGEQTPASPPARCEAWPGPIYGLDFTGHGQSTVPNGGGYTSEALMSDADAALGELGPCTILGRGLGGYVGLLLAGARPTDVRGAIIVDGPGLIGGGPGPVAPATATVAARTTSPDPWALVELARDPRPPDYAESFVGQAVHLSGLTNPISVCAIGRPHWLAAVAANVFVRVTDAASALADYATV